MQVSLADKPSAKEAWDSIAAARIGVDRVCRATLQCLRKEWENLSFCPREQIEDFSSSPRHAEVVDDPPRREEPRRGASDGEASSSHAQDVTACVDPGRASCNG